MKLKRRTFLIGTVLVGIGGVGLGRYALRGLVERSEIVVRMLCDHIIPGHDDVPGAVALGIDGEILEISRKTRRGHLGLLALTHTLDGLDFFTLARREQQAIIKAQLAAAAAAAAELTSREQKALDMIYNECVRRYLTRPEAWTALAYRTPQPHGYPDYTECSAS